MSGFVDAAWKEVVDQHSETFHRFSLSERQVSLSRGPDLFDCIPAPEASRSDIPGVRQFLQQPLIIERKYTYAPDVTFTFPQPAREMFTFDPKQIKPVDAKDMITFSPPLVSMFRASATRSLVDNRLSGENMPPLTPPGMSYITVEFKSLSVQNQPSAAIVEPVFVNGFLWDRAKKMRVSETWHFCVLSAADQQIYQSVLPLLDPRSLSAPRAVNFAIPKAARPDMPLELIVSLDRLCLRDAGVNATKYYEKPSKSSYAQLVSDLRDCGQPFVCNTFAFGVVGFDKLMVNAQGCTVDQFWATQSVSDQFLSESADASKAKWRQVPLQVTLGVSSRPEAPRLRHFYDIQDVAPAICSEFVNELIFRPVHVKFKLPRNLRPRNIMAQYMLVINEVSQPVFVGSQNNTIVFSRCQYHVEAPQFHDELVVRLPTDLPPNAYLSVRFFHLTVGGSRRPSREPCGSAVLPLFPSGEGPLLADGEHVVGIGYGASPESVPASEGNEFRVRTILRSVIHCSVPAIWAILRGSFDEPPPSFNSLIPHLIPALDTIFDAIGRGDAQAFNCLMKILSMCPTSRAARPTSQLLVVYVTYYAFRGDGMEGFHNMFVRLWLQSVKGSEVLAKSTAGTRAWFLFEVLTKALVVSPTTVDCGPILELVTVYCGALLGSIKGL
jgi:hypothetical protein